MARILVTYASRFGSTAEVANAIGETLTESGLDVDVLVAAPQIQVAKYDAVVIGSPAYGRKWLPDAVIFTAGNGERLKRLPVALFTVGMLGVKNPKSALREHEFIVRSLDELVDGLNPVSTALFHGSFDRSNLPFCLRIMDRLAGTPQGDRRNWDAIRGWAGQLGNTFLDADTREPSSDARQNGDSSE